MCHLHASGSDIEAPGEIGSLRRMASGGRSVRARDAIAAASVWLPLVIVIVTGLWWRDELAPDITLRNDVDSNLAPTLPTWLIFGALVAVLIGVGIGAVSVVPEGPNDAQSRRVPLFWCGAVAGVVVAVWVFQSWVAMHPPADPSRTNALMGFATIFAALYGLVPFFIAHRPLRD